MSRSGCIFKYYRGDLRRRRHLSKGLHEGASHVDIWVRGKREYKVEDMGTYLAL